MTTGTVDDRPPIRGGWVGRQWPLLLVLGGSLTSFVVVALGHFRTGCLGFGISVLLRIRAAKAKSSTT